MKKYKRVKKMLMKKWIPMISSETMSFENWEGILVSYW